MADEKLEQITVQIPREQVAWLRGRAYRHSRSLAHEVRSIVHLGMQTECLLGATSVFYATVAAPEPAPTGEAA